MNKYMYLFRGGDKGMAQMSPEEGEAHLNLWKSWMGDLGEAGHFVEGEPLKREGKLVRERGKVITDGPYMEGKELVGGYLIVSANSLEHAAELSKGCPIFDLGGTVEVREIAYI